MEVGSSQVHMRGQFAKGARVSLNVSKAAGAFMPRGLHFLPAAAGEQVTPHPFDLDLMRNLERS